MPNPVMKVGNLCRPLTLMAALISYCQVTIVFGQLKQERGGDLSHGFCRFLLSVLFLYQSITRLIQMAVFFLRIAHWRRIPILQPFTIHKTL